MKQGFVILPMDVLHEMPGPLVIESQLEAVQGFAHGRLQLAYLSRFVQSITRSFRE